VLDRREEPRQRHHQQQVGAAEQGGYHHVDERPVDDPVDRVEVMAEDRDGGGDRERDDRGRQ
jgi:hypothetical protein